MDDITPKQFLVLYLDTQFRNKELASFILYKTPVQNVAGRHFIADNGAKELIKKFWGKHTHDHNEELPVVCINCRTVLGYAMGSVVAETCHNCWDANLVTETRKATHELVRLFAEAGIKTRAPIVMHLAENPLPKVDRDRLNKK